MFPAPEPDGEPVRFGAVVEQIDDGVGPGTRSTQLLFWNDLAEVFASPGAEFEIWYSRVVGHGVVREILGDR